MGDFINKPDMLLTYQVRDLARLTNEDETAFLDITGNPRLAVDTDIVDIVLNQHIAIAESIIKGFVQGRYELPFAVVPEVIKKLALQLTYYYLNERKFTLNDSLIYAYEQNMQILKDINNGKMALDTLPGVNDFQDSTVTNIQNAAPDIDSEYLEHSNVEKMI